MPREFDTLEFRKKLARLYELEVLTALRKRLPRGMLKNRVYAACRGMLDEPGQE